MPIFLLTVKDPYHEDWKGYRPGFGEISKVVVRADSRKDAQDKAIEAAPWDSPTEGADLGKRIMREQPDLHPLQNSSITDCEPLDFDGPDMVIAWEALHNLPEPEA